MSSIYLSFFLSASMLYAQPHSQPNIAALPDWTPGLVVLETNDTVSCNLRYNQMVPEGLLQVLDGENVLTLSVRDVKCFFFFDSSRDRHRKFYTLSVPLDANVSREMFLEYVYGNDKVSILNHKTMGIAHAYMEYTPFKQPVPLSKLYLLDFRSGRLLPISEENALSLVDRRQKVAGFIRENGIRFRKVSDYIKIFEYEQSL